MTYKSKYSKYGSAKQAYGGRNYHSKKEANYAFELDMRIKAKEIKRYTNQHKIELYVNDCHVCDYFIDFRVEMNDGTYEYHEVKGFETDTWRIKWKLTQACYPEYKLVLIK
jgi:hypothetical protein